MRQQIKTIQPPNDQQLGALSRDGFKIHETIQNFCFSNHRGDIFPSLKLLPDKVVMYRNFNFYSISKGSHEVTDKQKENLTGEKNSGRLRPARIRFIKEKLKLWICSTVKTKRQVRFLTLTLPQDQKHDDLFMKQVVLKTYITRLQRNNDLKHYYWKAEAQKNGRIHFHLFVDCYFNISKDYNEASAIWIDVLSNYGYQNPTKFQSAFVEGIENQNMAISYITKYATKDELEPDSVQECLELQRTGKRKRPINGRIAEMSDSLRNLAVIPLDFIDDTFRPMIQSIQNSLYKLVEVVQETTGNLQCLVMLLDLNKAEKDSFYAYFWRKQYKELFKKLYYD